MPGTAGILYGLAQLITLALANKLPGGYNLSRKPRNIQQEEK